MIANRSILIQTYKLAVLVVKWCSYFEIIFFNGRHVIGFINGD
jgi:hypothetical protein